MILRKRRKLRAKAEFVDDGRAFWRARKRLRLSQEQLAAEFGVGPDTIGRWEMGWRKIRPMAFLALKYLESLESHESERKF